MTSDPRKRWKSHMCPKNPCIKLRRSINKYGKNSFEFKVICIGSFEYIQELEIKAIKFFDSIKNGYNISAGGSGYLKYVWNTDNNSLLGTMPDTILASKLKIGLGTVSRHRELLGIPTYNPLNILNKSLLGTMTDSQLADIYGVDNSTISYKRRLAGVDVFTHNPKLDIVLENSQLLLNKSNREVSRILGVTHAVVAKARKALGIPRINLSASNNITEDLLLKYRDAELSNMFGITKDYVVIIRKSKSIPSPPPLGKVVIPEDEIGTMLDKDLAKKYNCNHGMITKRRNKLGIPRFIPNTDNL